MEVQDNVLVLGGIEVRTLIAAYGSPLYVYEEDVLRERTRELCTAISYPNREVKYACKANTNLEIMRVLRAEGVGIDAVSPGEIHAALTAGFAPSDILFTVSNATADDMEFAHSRGVLINVDSLAQLRLIGEKYPGSEVCVRINPNVGAGHHNHVITGGPESKFGINYTRVDEIKRTAEKGRLKITGIHHHIGSGILKPAKFVEAMGVLLETARRFEGLSFIDFGGGIGVPYREDEERIDVQVLGKEISDEFSRFCNAYNSGLKLVIEPGRYMVAESGYLLTTVTAVKQGEKHRFIGVDTGFNQLIRPAMYGSYHRIINGSQVAGETVAQTIAGNICESGDTFTRDENGIVDRDLPVFEEGDIVCICNAGAYGFSMSSNYISRPRPAEVLVKDGNARCIRRRETIEDIFRTAVEL
jgi:diaminopimelate decarboxylase